MWHPDTCPVQPGCVLPDDGVFDKRRGTKARFCAYHARADLANRDAFAIVLTECQRKSAMVDEAAKVLNVSADDIGWTLDAKGQLTIELPADKKGRAGDVQAAIVSRLGDSKAVIR